MRFFFTKSQFPHYLLPILSFVPVFVQSVKKIEHFVCYISIFTRKCCISVNFVVLLYFVCILQAHTIKIL